MSSYQRSVDYYSVLGVSRDSSTKDINMAFKRLALKLHPDKSGGDRASVEQFYLVSCAYNDGHISYSSSCSCVKDGPKLITGNPRHKKQSRPFVILNVAGGMMSHFHDIHSI